MPGWITLAHFKHIVSKSWTHAREAFVIKDWSQTSISRDSVWSWDDVRGYWGSPEVCQRSFSPSKQISASAAIVMGWCVSACSTRTFGCVSLLDSPEWDVRWVVFSIRLVGYQTFKAFDHCCEFVGIEGKGQTWVNSIHFQWAMFSNAATYSSRHKWGHLTVLISLMVTMTLSHSPTL